MVSMSVINSTVDAESSQPGAPFGPIFASIADAEGMDAMSGIVASTHVVVMLSQVVVILMAVGLEGNFSAQTLMWLQAAMEILKRVSTLYNQLCNDIGKREQLQ